MNKKKNNNKNLWYILLGIITITLLVILVYQAMQPKKIISKETLQVPVPSSRYVEDMESVCSRLCFDKGYDGYTDTGGTSHALDSDSPINLAVVYQCDCYDFMR